MVSSCVCKLTRSSQCIYILHKQVRNSMPKKIKTFRFNPQLHESFKELASKEGRQLKRTQKRLSHLALKLKDFVDAKMRLLRMKKRKSYGLSSSFFGENLFTIIGFFRFVRRGTFQSRKMLLKLQRLSPNQALGCTWIFGCKTARLDRLNL